MSAGAMRRVRTSSDERVRRRRSSAQKRQKKKEKQHTHQAKRPNPNLAPPKEKHKNHQTKTNQKTPNQDYHLQKEQKEPPEKEPSHLPARHAKQNNGNARPLSLGASRRNRPTQRAQEDQRKNESDFNIDSKSLKLEEEQLHALTVAVSFADCNDVTKNKDIALIVWPKARE